MFARMTGDSESDDMDLPEKVTTPTSKEPMPSMETADVVSCSIVYFRATVKAGSASFHTRVDVAPACLYERLLRAVAER